MRKKIPCKVIKTFSINNYSKYFDYSNINHHFHGKNIYNPGTMFYTEKMKTIITLNNDYITENSFDCYA